MDCYATQNNKFSRTKRHSFRTVKNLFIRNSSDDETWDNYNHVKYQRRSEGGKGGSHLNDENLVFEERSNL